MNLDRAQRNALQTRAMRDIEFADHALIASHDHHTSDEARRDKHQEAIAYGTTALVYVMMLVSESLTHALNRDRS